jgi:hypothetical protein
MNTDNHLFFPMSDPARSAAASSVDAPSAKIVQGEDIYTEQYTVVPSRTVDGSSFFPDLDTAVSAAIERLTTASPHESYAVFQLVKRVSLGARPPIVQDVKLPDRTFSATTRPPAQVLYELAHNKPRGHE